MAEKRDYYEVLGVDRNATADDIKSAYRKMALKWHPDRWVNGTDAEKKTAEENFKEASEAYSVLSDPDKKARYDRFGQAGLGGDGAPDFSGGFGNLNDILNALFGIGGCLTRSRLAWNRQPQSRGTRNVLTAAAREQ